MFISEVNKQALSQTIFVSFAPLASKVIDRSRKIKFYKRLQAGSSLSIVPHSNQNLCSLC